MSGRRVRYRGELLEADGGRPISRHAGKGQPSTDSILFEAPKGCPIIQQLLGSFFLLNRSTLTPPYLHISIKRPSTYLLLYSTIVLLLLCYIIVDTSST